ncbi:MAG: hypothetical protein HC876_11865 [Chloroflexaceae bacterium]|nr:hypothetical protein [Chloroflexaceae bacterium]NJO06149.1 hypothetical protein [Chloroflexaceae bacterium]
MTVDELVERLIREKCQRTAMVGAVTSGSAFIPGLGTLAALTVGVAADIGMTFKLQAELVLEIAAAYERTLNEGEKQRAIMVVTGLSAGGVQLSSNLGARVSSQLTERYAQKWLAHALPIIGVAASAGTNVLATYIIGKRAQAYFGLGPEAMGDWGESLRAIVGVDERKIAGWVSETGTTVGSFAQQAGTTVGGFAQQAGTNVVQAGGTLVGTVGNAAGTAFETVRGATTAAGTVVGGWFSRNKKTEPTEPTDQQHTPQDG